MLRVGLVYFFVESQIGGKGTSGTEQNAEWAQSVHGLLLGMHKIVSNQFYFFCELCDSV